MSDTPEAEIPRLPFSEEDAKDIVEVIKDLYLEVLRTLNHNPNSTPEEVLQRVATSWMIIRQGPFMMLLTYWSATSYEPPEIWQDPTTSCDNEMIMTPVFTKSWRLKPVEEIDLQIGDFGGGSDFFACMENRDAVSQAEYDLLGEKFDERDAQLAARASV